MGIKGNLIHDVFDPKTISLDNDNWTRISGFGKLYHLLKNHNRYTVCGYDISLFDYKKTQKSPKTKCNRCIEIIRINQAKQVANFWQIIRHLKITVVEF